MMAGAYDRAAALGLLEKHWGYTSFRPAQEEIISSFVAGNDTLGLLPTGGGKSITFQIPALLSEGLTVVVTPLISLMKDQVDNLRERGVMATCLYSGLTRAEVKLGIDRCRLGKVKMLYVSPERLQSKSFIETLRLMKVTQIVVDEAHCISQWGYDFRPSYLKIKDLRKTFPGAPVLALTASATPEVASDIMEQLEFRSRDHVYSRSFSRDNISYVVRYCDHKEGKLREILHAVAGTGIVYVRSRKLTRQLSDMLVADGISADFYHAGLAPEDKNEKQNRWKSGETRVIVATNAFGMGIDKPDVRLVVHYDLPSSLEEYYQEAGRAGRDGLPSFAVVLASRADKGTLTRRVSQAFPEKGFISRVYELAGNFLDVAVGEGYNQVYPFDFNTFCVRFKVQPLAAHSALTLLTRAGWIEFTEEIATQSRVMMLVTKSELYQQNLTPNEDKLLQLLLRSYTGLFADYVPINETLLQSRTGLGAQEVYDTLLSLTRKHVLHFIPRKTSPYIFYTTSREEPRYITMPKAVYEDQKARLEKRVESMKQFVYAQDGCRVQRLLNYFGETTAGECGKCDLCRARRVAARGVDWNALEKSILYLSGQPGGHTVGYIQQQLDLYPKEAVVQMIRSLADRSLVKLDLATFNVVKVKN
ncbi:MAG: RecQ family ATP-dependent DNA helicase [Bacteroidales bacterium]|nr:RecQ family ATP-dependent DNA helicase [Bacteroidales bacterium]